MSHHLFVPSSLHIISRNLQVVQLANSKPQDGEGNRADPPNICSRIMLKKSFSVRIENYQFFN